MNLHDKLETRSESKETATEDFMSATLPLADIIVRTMRLIYPNDYDAYLCTSSLRGVFMYKWDEARSKSKDEPNKNLELFIYPKIAEILRLATEKLEESLCEVVYDPTIRWEIKHRKRQDRRFVKKLYGNK